MNTKIATPHNKSSGPHEWVCLGEKRWLARDATDRDHTTLWLIAVCNNPDCHGRGLINAFAAGTLLDPKTTT